MLSLPRSSSTRALLSSELRTFLGYLGEPSFDRRVGSLGEVV